MREIKFRGRRKNSTEWVYGAFLTIPRLCSYIYDVQHGAPVLGLRFVVDPKTVGQFTGLRDCEGREIYEGDILDITYISKHDYLRYCAVVQWYDFGFMLKSLDSDCDDVSFSIMVTTDSRFKVIGNIHDNPALLEES